MAGVAASYWYHPYVLSAGASGAIFGLFGVLLVFSIKYRKTIPAFFSQALGKGILLTVGINLAIGFFVPQIDLAAHVGGFIAGGLLAVAIPFARPGEPEHPVFKFLQVALVAVVAVSFFQVATHYAGPGLSVPSLSRGRGDSTGTFISSMNQAQEAFEHSEMELESGDLGLLPVVEKELGQAIDAMSEIPHLSADADKLSSQLLDLLRKQHAYVKEVEQTGRTRSDFIGASPQSVRYKRLKSAIEEWVDQEGAVTEFRTQSSLAKPAFFCEIIPSLVMLTTETLFRISQEVGASASRVEATVSLLEGGATVPFIARYRKEATGNLDEVKIQDIDECRLYYTALEQRREAILASIQGQGKLTDELKQKIEGCYSKGELEDLYLPYKPKRRTKAGEAMRLGLGPLADYIWEQTGNEPVGVYAERFISPPEPEAPTPAVSLSSRRARSGSCRSQFRKSRRNRLRLPPLWTELPSRSVICCRNPPQKVHPLRLP